MSEYAGIPVRPRTPPARADRRTATLESNTTQSTMLGNIIGGGAFDDAQQYTMGYRITWSANVTVTGCYWYKPTTGVGSAQTVRSFLWIQSTGVLVASSGNTALSDDDTVGWHYIEFAVPYDITGGTEYVAGVGFGVVGDQGYQAENGALAGNKVSPDGLATITAGEGAYNNTFGNMPDILIPGTTLYGIDVAYEYGTYNLVAYVPPVPWDTYIYDCWPKCSETAEVSVYEHTRDTACLIARGTTGTQQLSSYWPRLIRAGTPLWIEWEDVAQTATAEVTLMIGLVSPT